MQPARRNAIRLPKLFILAAVFALALAGCSASTIAPTATITEPAANAKFQIGQPINIVVKANGTGLKMVDVYANTTPLARVDQPTTGNEFSFTVPWVPDVGGPVYLLLKGLNDKGESIVSSDPVFITIEGQPTPVPVPPTEIPAPTAVPQPTLPPLPAAGTTTTTTTTTATDASSPTTTTVAPAPAGGASVVPVGEFANVRKGPGLTYDVVGQLKASQSVTVKGKSDDGAWWQINFPGAADGVAWVNGQVVTFTGDAAKIAIAKAPPAPTAAPAPVVTQQIVPIAAPTSAAPAPTAASALPSYVALPYFQNMRFSVNTTNRDDIGDVPLGYNGEGKSAKLLYKIEGARSAELQITTGDGSGIYENCKAGNLGTVSLQEAVNKRMSLTMPEGTLPFSIEGGGYYLFTIFVTKADGSQTTIPRAVIVDCYKK